MVPSILVPLSNMPWTRSEKIDHLARVRGCKKESLGYNRNFLHLGGYSLHDVLMVISLHRHGLELLIKQAFAMVARYFSMTDVVFGGTVSGPTLPIHGVESRPLLLCP
jgi:hypothetical protein